MTTPDRSPRPRRHPGPLAALLLSALCPLSAAADDAEVVKALKDKGAEAAAAKGVVTALAVRDGSKMTDAEVRTLRRETLGALSRKE